MPGSSIHLINTAVIQAASDLYMACSQAAIERVKEMLIERASAEDLNAEQLLQVARALLMREDWA